MFDSSLLKRIDWITVLLVLALFAVGILSIASIMADPFDGTEAGISDYIDKLNLYYVKKQVVNFLIGFAALLVFIVLDYKVFKFVIKYAYIANLALLLILFATESTRGIQGWMNFDFVNRALQPGELCKICIIIMLSVYVSECMDKEGRFQGFGYIIKTTIYCLVPTVLVMMQPDFGTAFVYICIMVFIYFIGKVSWGYIGAAAGAVAVGLPLAYFFLMDTYQQERIQVFLDPTLDPLGAGYNVIQSKTAIGSGELFGKGFFSEGTLAQLRFVPERHTDFIFAGIVEGLGFIGGTLLIVMYFALIFRWIYMAMKVKDSFGSCLIVGVAGMLTAHVFENIGMTIGLMPVTGIPLPFISYGGSNLLTNLIGVGIVENVWMRRPSKKR